MGGNSSNFRASCSVVVVYRKSQIPTQSKSSDHIIYNQKSRGIILWSLNVASLRTVLPRVDIREVRPTCALHFSLILGVVCCHQSSPPTSVDKELLNKRSEPMAGSMIFMALNWAHMKCLQVTTQEGTGKNCACRLPGLTLDTTVPKHLRR
jgi:hypothetical protein